MAGGSQIKKEEPSEVQSSTPNEKRPSILDELQIPPSALPPEFRRPPADAIARLKREIDESTSPKAIVNLEALLSYYEEGGRYPEGEEELWAINGKLYWGIKRYPADFPGDTFFKGTKHCEVRYIYLCVWKRIIKADGSARQQSSDSDSHRRIAWHGLRLRSNNPVQVVPFVSSSRHVKP